MPKDIEDDQGLWTITDINGADKISLCDHHYVFGGIDVAGISSSFSR